jgi:hypothetical protein
MTRTSSSTRTETRCGSPPAPAGCEFHDAPVGYRGRGDDGARRVGEL